ncbi:protein STIP1 homolog [Lineus longissimus]|uniref:protein STIP1 homolog n=1 Tax=Lineus longissimus TaxID=88925 RepID=UPI002B4F449C
MHPEAEELKKKGNDCVKEQKFAEAVLHYSHALKMDPNNHLLYSNRSLAFLKMEQHYHALEDAKTVIKMQPKWPKGYFRKGEVEAAAEHYWHALMSYETGLLYDPEDEGLQKAKHKAAVELTKLRKAEKYLPRKGIGTGFLIGSCIVLADHLLTKQPSIQYIVLKVLLVLVFSGIGYGVTCGYKSMMDSQKKSLLEPPHDLLKDFDKGPKDGKECNEPGNVPPSNKEERHRRRSGQAAARQRFKKGKS